MNNNRWNDRNRRNRGDNDQNRWDQNTGYSGSGNWGNDNNNRNRGYGQGSSFSGSNTGDNEYGSRSSYGGGQYGRDNDRYGNRGNFGSSYGSDYGNNYRSGNEGRQRGSGNEGRQWGSGNYGDAYGSGFSGFGGSSFAGSGYSGSGSRGYEGSGNYRSNDEYSRSYDRSGGQSDRYGNEDRNFFDKAGDEISSWFGDEEARRRRERDQRENDSYGNRNSGSSWMGGEHKGKGPKNYQRSDERIKEDINDKLSDDWGLDASEVDVHVSNGEVTLTGSVNNRTAKRRAEDIAENVSGVRNVENRLRVSETNTAMGNQHTGSYSSTSGTGTTGEAGTTNATNRKSVV